MENKEYIKIIELSRQIVPKESLLHTRLYGKRFFECFKQILVPNNAEKVIVFSFQGIELMDGSFADEAFGTLAALRARRELLATPFYLAELEPTSFDNLAMALESRTNRESGYQEKLRNCTIPVLENSELILVGKAEEHVKQTFLLLLQRGKLNARQLADELNLNLNAASTRLKTLTDLGLALRTELRDEQGKQYLYSSLV